MSNQSITEYLSAHEFFSEFSDDVLKFGYPLKPGQN
jgi:hypothetical protein